MAENNKEDILEQSEDEGSDGGSAKKSLSTGLLIKIAIGLAVLLIVLAGALFFFKSSEQASSAENTKLNETQQPVADNEQTETNLVGTSTKESNLNTDSNNPPAAATSSIAEKALVQMIELQKQISDLKVENQNLNKTIDTLTKENNELKKQVKVFTDEVSSAEIPLDQLVNTQDLPRDYRRDNYANAPKFELEPKWGEFEKTTNTN